MFMLLVCFSALVSILICPFFGDSIVSGERRKEGMKDGFGAGCVCASVGGTEEGRGRRWSWRGEVARADEADGVLLAAWRSAG